MIKDFMITIELQNLKSSKKKVEIMTAITNDSFNIFANAILIFYRLGQNISLFYKIQHLYTYY